MKIKVKRMKIMRAVVKGYIMKGEVDETQPYSDL